MRPSYPGNGGNVNTLPPLRGAWAEALANSHKAGQGHVTPAAIVAQEQIGVIDPSDVEAEFLRRRGHLPAIGAASHTNEDHHFGPLVERDFGDTGEAHAATT